MISDFASTLSTAWSLLGLEFTLYGFSLSFREVLLWSAVAGIVLWFIGRLFDNG